MRPSKIAMVTTLLAVLAPSLRADAAAGQDRVRRSIEGPVTREAVTRSLAVVPDNAGEPEGVSEVGLMLRIEFEFDSAELTTPAMRDLDGVAAALTDPQLTEAQLTLEGHTDATGSEDYNLRLSQRRAEAVVRYLAGRGVPGARLRAVGFGEDRLLPAYAPTDDEQRRVEIVRTF
ncbi:MAG: OmpA family protein [Acidobacteria bacterium]|nr:OmpA family protein [Acidobacteriota bacterium]